MADQAKTPVDAIYKKKVNWILFLGNAAVIGLCVAAFAFGAGILEEHVNDVRTNAALARDPAPCGLPTPNIMYLRQGLQDGRYNPLEEHHPFVPPLEGGINNNYEAWISEIVRGMCNIRDEDDAIASIAVDGDTYPKDNTARSESAGHVLIYQFFRAYLNADELAFGPDNPTNVDTATSYTWEKVENQMEMLMCAINDKTNRKVYGDLKVRIARAYIAAMPAFYRYNYRLSEQGGKGCLFDSNPFLFNTDTCPNAAFVNAQLVLAGNEKEAIRMVGAKPIGRTDHKLPRMSTMLYRLMALSAVGHIDRRDKKGCFFNGDSATPLQSATEFCTNDVFPAAGFASVAVLPSYDDALALTGSASCGQAIPHWAESDTLDAAIAGNGGVFADGATTGVLNPTCHLPYLLFNGPLASDSRTFELESTKYIQYANEKVALYDKTVSAETAGRPARCTLGTDYNDASPPPPGFLDDHVHSSESVPVATTAPSPPQTPGDAALATDTTLTDADLLQRMRDACALSLEYGLLEQERLFGIPDPIDRFVLPGRNSDSTLGLWSFGYALGNIQAQAWFVDVVYPNAPNHKLTAADEVDVATTNDFNEVSNFKKPMDQLKLWTMYRLAATGVWGALIAAILGFWGGYYFPSMYVIFMGLVLGARDVQNPDEIVDVYRTNAIGFWRYLSFALVVPVALFVIYGDPAAQSHYPYTTDCSDWSLKGDDIGTGAYVTTWSKRRFDRAGELVLIWFIIFAFGVIVLNRFTGRCVSDNVSDNRKKFVRFIAPHGCLQSVVIILAIIVVLGHAVRADYAGQEWLNYYKTVNDPYAIDDTLRKYAHAVASDVRMVVYAAFWMGLLSGVVYALHDITHMTFIHKLAYFVGLGAISWIPMIQGGASLDDMWALVSSGKGVVSDDRSSTTTLLVIMTIAIDVTLLVIYCQVFRKTPQVAPVENKPVSAEANPEEAAQVVVKEKREEAQQQRAIELADKLLIEQAAESIPLPPVNGPANVYNGASLQGMLAPATFTFSNLKDGTVVGRPGEPITGRGRQMSRMTYGRSKRGAVPQFDASHLPLLPA